MKPSYEELEAKCAALAAENAALKAVESNLVRNIINDIGDTEFQYEKVQTPATDACLAEMRAQGVEMFLVFCGEENSVFVESKAYYRSLSDAVAEFAAQLRQEAAQ